MTSLGKRNNKKRSGSRDKKHTNLLKHDSKPESPGSKLPDSCITRFLKVFPKNQIDQNELHLNDISQSKKKDMPNGTAQLSYKSPCKRKKAFSKLKGSYSLRSLDSGRVLRSRVSTSKCSTSLNPASNPGNLVTRSKKRGKKKGKQLNQDELSRIKKHIRYMLNRMNYEQSLIDAYSGEGWKGQSAEKIRPEKELGRAKSEILRCKLKIREIFQQLDSLLAEGRIQESLFDPDGIDSENIFCGKCGSKEVSVDNDIILCDGVCERGFHQKCLNPPLLSEDIPSGDEGWLCPQCECKLECIDLLSDFLGKDLSIEDSWKKFFPEAATLANGNGLHDDLNLPSDDSEDDDYNPDNQGVDVDEQEEGPGFDVSDSSSSYVSASADNNVGQAAAELSTDDSDDGDYDPDAVDPDKEIQKTISSSDESDFTSDSDEFCAELGRNAHADATSAPCPQTSEFLIDTGRVNMKSQDNSVEYSKLPSPMLELEKQENGLLSTNKRDRERLDYKKLYDEEYGKSSSDSSDDEDWNEMCTPKKLMKTANEGFEEGVIRGAAKSTEKLQNSISSISAAKAHVPHKPHFSGSSSPRFRKKSSISSKILYEAFQENQYPTKERKESLAQEAGMTFQQVTKWFGNARHSFRASFTPHGATDAVGTTTLEDYYKKKMNVVFQENQYPSKEKKEELARGQGMTPQEILHKAFQEEQYPTKEKKEILAQEIGMTFKQVSKWFGNARHSFRAASNRHEVTDTIRTTTHEECYKKKLNEVFQENQYPSKEKKEELAQELGMTPQKVSIWFQTARRNFHASAKDSSDPTISRSDKAEVFGCRKLDSDAIDETPGAKINTPKSCTSTRKSRKKIETKSPEIPTPTAGSEGGKNVNGEDDRQKAIAKELRRMRAGR